MPKFHVEVQWSGYSRGKTLYEVEAECSEDAKEIAIYEGGEVLLHEVVRSDIESDEAKLI